jgi:F0F1-type ATP synthase beta subunit
LIRLRLRRRRVVRSDPPEQAFMYVGPVEQAVEKAKKLQA